jgi:hypothetical protein
MAKRARERARQDRKEAKQARREATTSALASGDAPDEAALMEEFRVASERHAAGHFSDEALQLERHRIFVALGIETEDDA